MRSGSGEYAKPRCGVPERGFFVGGGHGLSMDRGAGRAQHKWGVRSAMELTVSRGLSGEEAAMAAVVSPLRTRTPTILKFMAMRISV